MNSTVFKELPQTEQFAFLQKDGVYIGKRDEDQWVVILFQLAAFYVEVYYTQYRKSVHHLVISDSISIMQPYLEQVEVRDLKNPAKEI